MNKIKSCERIYTCHCCGKRNRIIIEAPTDLGIDYGIAFCPKCDQVVVKVVGREIGGK